MLLVRLAQHRLRVYRFVDAVGEEAVVAVAAPHEVKGDDGDPVFCDEGEDSKYFYLAAAVAVEVEEGVLDGAVLLAQDDCADVAAVVAGHAEDEMMLTTHQPKAGIERRHILR